jgi:type IV secretion system protein VirB10
MKGFERAGAGPTPDSADAVSGERGLPSVRQPASLQSRISNMLAMSLMLAMGAAVLTGYFLQKARRPAPARQPTVQTELPLPALPAISAAVVMRSGEPGAVPASDVLPAVLAPAQPPSTTALLPVPAASTSIPPDVYARPARASSLERRLSGAAFAPAQSAGDGEASVAAPAAVTATVTAVEAAVPPGPMAALLHSESTAASPARLLSTQRLLLPKGAFIDCTLETAIDSSLPGMTTCVTASDTFGVDGKVVLLERGTKLVGETRGQVQQGTARVFVLWTQARTPTGVIVPLDSPGTDELGRSGLAGTVDRHFWERFGAALLISTIDGGVQAAVQSSNRGNGTIVYNPSATQDLTTEVLKSTLSIAPTVRKDNGDRIQVLVARDIDFTGVYELRRADGH